MLILNCTWKGKGTRIANSEILKKKKVFADDPAGFLCAGRHGYYVVLFVSLKVYFFFFFLAAPHGMWDLSCRTRDQTQAPAEEAQSLNHWTTRVVPQGVFLITLVPKEVLEKFQEKKLRALNNP